LVLSNIPQKQVHQDLIELHFEEEEPLPDLASRLANKSNYGFQLKTKVDKFKVSTTNLQIKADYE
jgi:hypothetical protein